MGVIFRIGDTMTTSRRVWYFIANSAFLLCWALLCALTVRQWHEITAGSRFYAPIAIAAFLVLWSYMLREKNGTSSIAVAAVALLASLKMAFG